MDASQFSRIGRWLLESKAGQGQGVRRQVEALRIHQEIWAFSLLSGSIYLALAAHLCRNPEKRKRLLVTWGGALPKDEFCGAQWTSIYLVL